MAQQVSQIRVFVSSPGDVEEERRVLDHAVARINRLHGDRRQARLETFKWEKNVVPRIGPPPQEVVDEQTPVCDIYLGIMSSRFGTATKGHGSGTESEFRDALERWGETGAPWIMFYFRDDPPLSRKPADVQQYLRVCEFREEIESLGIVRGYRGVRGDENGFYDQAQEHLTAIFLQLTDEPEPVAPCETPAAATAVPVHYLSWLKRECAAIELLGLELKQGHAVRLNQVYVSLTTAAGDPEVDRDEDEERRVRAGLPRESPGLLLERLDQGSLYVSGAPGSGKSTFCRWVAWLVATGELPPAEIEPEEGYRENFPESLAGRLPLLVRLRDFWSFLPTTLGVQELSATEFAATLGRWVAAKSPGGLERAELEAHLAAGTALLILDGVDEVPLIRGNEGAQYYPRALLLSGMTAAVSDWLNRGNRVLVTSRPYGVSVDEGRRLSLPHAPIADLDPALQVLLVRRWFHLLDEDAVAGEATAGELLAEIGGREELGSLVANPMLLTAVCVIYSQGKRVPQEKYELYDRIVENVLYNRYRDPATIDLVRSRLCVIAHGMHTGSGLGEDRTTPQAEVTEAEIDAMLEAYKAQIRTEDAYRDIIETRERLLSESGLLLPRGDQRAAFYHLTFQDFLTAQWVQDIQSDCLADVFRRRAPVREWHSTLSFVFGSLLANNTTPTKATRLLNALIESITDDSLPLAVVVGEAIDILMGRTYRLEPALEDRFREICINAIQTEAPIEDRWPLGLALGGIGDPRIVTDLRHPPEGYVRIEAGDYKVGKKRRRFHLERSFLLSRYPVTNQQYALFVEVGGYDEERWWTGEGWSWLQGEGIREPRYWRASKWHGSNQPVVGVSFFEAEAFAAWAGGRLPGEFEWEAAARGPEGRQYPWGDEFVEGICNHGAYGLSATSPVGVFPSGCSSSGVEDLAGNVWEWTDSQFDEDEDLRVLRGGSWFDGPVRLRSSFRTWYFPDWRSYFVGFRLAQDIV